MLRRQRAVQKRGNVFACGRRLALGKCERGLQALHFGLQAFRFGLQAFRLDLQLIDLAGERDLVEFQPLVLVI
jgi:hypothetical protein